MLSEAYNVSDSLANYFTMAFDKHALAKTRPKDNFEATLKQHKADLDQILSSHRLGFNQLLEKIAIGWANTT